MITPEQLLAKREPGDTLDRPLEHLVACHRRIEERLATLELAADHFSLRRQEALDAAASCFRFFDSNGAWHTEDEERSLFPRMRTRLSAEELAYLETLEQQHDEAEALYAEVKAHAGGVSAGIDGSEARYRETVQKLAAIYRAHIASEDEMLTALGRRVLDDAALRLISIEMKQRRGLLP